MTAMLEALVARHALDLGVGLAIAYVAGVVTGAAGFLAFLEGRLRPPELEPSQPVRWIGWVIFALPVAFVLAVVAW